MLSDLLPKDLNVPRETIKKLELYDQLLKKWNNAYNLVDQGTLLESISRHFLDSMQLYNLIDLEKSLIDLGSGAGFPGMVLAIMGATQVTLVESNRKKCLFLNEVSRQTSTMVEILNYRLETIQDKFHQITARAFTNLAELLLIMQNVSRETGGVGFFLKGETWQQEIESSLQQGWRFSYEAIPSTTQEKGAIIKVWDVRK